MANVANVKVKVGNVLSLSGSSVEITGSQVRTTGDLVVGGKIVATQYEVTQVTSSVIFTSGSTKFGDTPGLPGVGDTHEFTGSILVTNSVSATEFTGSGAGLTGIIKSVTADTNLTASTVSGVTTVALTSSITGGLNTLSGVHTGSFGVLSASAAEFSGNVLIYGTASLSSNPDAAYVRYTGLPEDKILIYPGLKVSGSSVVSGNLDVTGSVSASSFTGSGAGLTNLPATNLNGVVSLANGGTGKDLSASISSGKLLIGSGSELVVGELTQGSGILITKNSGSIEIASTALASAVTQVTSSDPNLVIQSGSGPAVTASLTPNPTFGNLTVTSSLNVSASLQRTRRTVTGSVSVAATDQAIFVNPAAATVVTLPSPTALDGRELIVKRVDDPLTAFTVDVSGATIDDSGSFGLNGPMQSITLIADSGSNKWFVV